MGWLRKSKKLDQKPRRPAEGNNRAVFSYYARGVSTDEDNTGRRKDQNISTIKHYRLQLGLLPSYFAYLAILFAMGYSCLLVPSPKIILVNTPDTVHRDPSVYQEAIETIWNKSILNRTKLTVSTSRIKQDINSQFGELANVQIELPLLGRRPTVILIPVKPALQLLSSNGSFYVDLGGRVMARTTDLTQNALKQLPLIRDETGVLAEPGKVVIPAAQASFLTNLHAQLLAQNIDVESITLPPRAANEADIRIVGLPYTVKFSIGSDPRQAVGTYQATKAKLDKEGVTPAEYIDLRVEEKVFYK